MTMVDMALPPREIKEELATPAPASSDAKVPRYPWGLAIRLSNEELDKLGLGGELPKAGEVIEFEAVAKVTSASQNEMVNDKGEKTITSHVELQITKMSVGGDAEEDAREASAARRKRFYGDDEK